MPLPSIDDDEIRQRLLLVEPPREVARHDLAHRREIVGRTADDRFDLELPILGALRPAVLEPDTRRDRVRALRRRDVEADHRAWNALQPELSLQLVHGIDGALLGLERRRLLLFEQMPRVLVGELDELSPRPALRHPDRDARKRLLDQLAIADIERDQQLARVLGERDVRARDDRPRAPRRRPRPAMFSTNWCSRASSLPAANAEHRHHGVLSVARVADHVAIATFDLDDDCRAPRGAAGDGAHRAAHPRARSPCSPPPRPCAALTRRVTSAARPSR